MNIYGYNKKKNLTVFFCWIMTNIVTTSFYILEFLKHNKDFTYFVTVMLFTWLPLVIAYGKGLMIGRGELRIKYDACIGYIIFYTFILFTVKNAITFIYAIPMLIVFLVYDDVKLIDFYCIVTIILNLFRIMLDYYTTQEFTDEELLFCEIRVSCLIVCSLFIHFVSKLVAYGNSQMEKLNINIQMDNLTGAYNRYYLEQYKKAVNFESDNISMAIIDIDAFKLINDTYGHKFGDLVLRKIAVIFKDYTDLYDDTDFIRIGGDEFIILSKTLNKNQLYDIMENACIRICKTSLAYNESVVKFTVSIGIANNQEDKLFSYNKLYEYADSKLYTVKHNGKSSVAK